MYRLTNKLLFSILTLISTSVFSLELTPTEITLNPNKPIVLANTNPKKITLLCEVHVASSAKHHVSINVIAGKGIFNGTTFKQGDSLISAMNHMQQIPVSADPGTKAQVTNLGPNIMKIICG